MWVAGRPCSTSRRRASHWQWAVALRGVGVEVIEGADQELADDLDAEVSLPPARPTCASHKAMELVQGRGGGGLKVELAGGGRVWVGPAGTGGGPWGHGAALAGLRGGGRVAALQGAAEAKMGVSLIRGATVVRGYGGSGARPRGGGRLLALRVGVVSEAGVPLVAEGGVVPLAGVSVFAKQGGPLDSGPAT